MSLGSKANLGSVLYGINYTVQNTSSKNTSLCIKNNH